MYYAVDSVGLEFKLNSVVFIGQNQTGPEALVRDMYCCRIPSLWFATDPRLWFLTSIVGKPDVLVLEVNHTIMTRRFGPYDVQV
jgi:hypothetical protein